MQERLCCNGGTNTKLAGCRVLLSLVVLGCLAAGVRAEAPRATSTTTSPACPAPPAGTAPVNPPTGRFAIDGDLRANAPVAGIGDWIPGASGSGGSVLNASGCPLNTGTTLHLIDLANSGSDNNFSGGFKVDDNPNVWGWTLNPVNGKQDLKHAMVHTTHDPNTGHFWIVIAATRESNNGDSYIDFEFLQNGISLTNPNGISGGFSSAGPHGGRTLNDFILTLNLTRGGTQAGLCVERWKLVAGSNPPKYDYFDDTSNLPAGAVFTAVNSASVSIPNCPSGSLDTYPVNSFAEAAVDLTAFVGDFDQCATVAVKNILVKTKESQSPTANIVDFIAPIPVQLVIGPNADAGADQAKCTEGNSTQFAVAGNAKAGTHPIASMTWTVVTGNVTLDPPASCANCTSLPLNVHVSGAPATATLRLTVVDTGGCTKTDEVNLTVNVCTGACCLPCPFQPDSFLNTCVVVTESQCAAQHGNFHGLGSACPGATCGTCHGECFLSCPGDTDLGCNPQTIPGCDTSSVTVNGCIQPSTLACAASDTVSGCIHTRTLTYTATGCDSIVCSCSRRVTWTVATSPVFNNCETGTTDLGCNPADVPTCDTAPAVAAHNECGSVTVVCAGGSDSVDGCRHRRTLTYTATSCGLTSTCRRTYTWTVVTAPVFDNCVTGSTDLGCNPASIPTCDTAPAVTAHNECGAVTATCDGGTDTVEGCHHSRTLTYTATACGLNSTCRRTYTWTVVTAPVFDNCVTGSTNLGCNPANVPNCQTADAVSAHNECGAVTVSCDGGTDTVDGCHHSRTLTYTATACGLTNTCRRTYTWTVVSAPVFDNCATGSTDLGCNPAAIPTCGTASAITAHNECGAVDVSCDGGTDTVDGCHHSRTLTYTAVGCGLTNTCAHTYTWTVATAPVFDNCTTESTDLGCNPASVPNCDTAPAVTAHNECGAVDVSCAGGTDAVSGCHHSITLTYTATACGLSNSCSRTYTWTVVTAPIFDNCENGSIDLGCNPAFVPNCQTAAAVTARNECGLVDVFCDGGTDSVDGCHHRRTLTFTASACGLTSTCRRTYNWTEVTMPVFDTCVSALTDLGCNPESVPTCLTAPAVTAHNECGAVDVTCDGGKDSVDGCYHSRTLTYMAASCGLTNVCALTYTWSEVTAPVFDNCATGTTDLGCNPKSVPTCDTAGAVTAHNECGPAGVVCDGGKDSVDGCHHSRTLTYTATACSLSNTCALTYTWIEATPPVFDNCRDGNTNLGCVGPNPVNLPECDASITATGSCGVVQVTCCKNPGEDGSCDNPDSTTNCLHMRTLRYTATDGCGQTTTCTQTFAWNQN